MPNSLMDNPNVEFIAAKPFDYGDNHYEMGDDFPREDFTKIDMLIRARFIVPVVEDLADKPHTSFFREVRQKDEAKSWLFRDRTQIVFPEPEVTAGLSTLSVQTSQGTATEPGEGGEPTAEEPGDEGPAQDEYDPSAHNVNAVLAYMEANPSEAAAVREAERSGKNRKGIVEGY